MQKVVNICLALFVLVCLISGCESSYDKAYHEGYADARSEYYDDRYDEGYHEGYQDAKTEMQDFFFSRMDEDGTLDAFWDKWIDDIDEYDLAY